MLGQDTLKPHPPMFRGMSVPINAYTITVVVDCGTLSAPKGGQVELSGTGVDDKAYYSCNSGYVLVGGDERRVCQDNGEWSGEPPSCDRKNCR